MKKISFFRVLQIAIGFVLIVEGVDKFFNKIADWPVYTAPQVLDLLPIAHHEFLGILGITEVVVGIIFLASARYGGLLAAILMFGIVINLIILGNFYNIALLNTIVALTALSISQAAQYKKPPPLPPPIINKKPKKSKKTKN